MVKPIILTKEDMQKLNNMRNEVIDSYNTQIFENLDEIIKDISNEYNNRSRNGIWKKIYGMVKKGYSEELYERNQKPLLNRTNFSKSLLNRIHETFYLERNNPYFAEYIRKNKELPGVID